MLGLSWGRGKRLHFMCLPECVCVCGFHLCMVTYTVVIFKTPLLLKAGCSCFGPALPSQNVTFGFTCSSHALCSEEHRFVLHSPPPKTSLLLLPFTVPVQHHHGLHREDWRTICLIPLSTCLHYPVIITNIQLKTDLPCCALVPE